MVHIDTESVYAHTLFPFSKSLVSLQSDTAANASLVILNLKLSQSCQLIKFHFVEKYSNLLSKQIVYSVYRPKGK